MFIYDVLIAVVSLILVFLFRDLKKKLNVFLFIVLPLFAFLWRFQFSFIEITNKFSNTILTIPEIILIILWLYSFFWGIKSKDNALISKYFIYLLILGVFEIFNPHTTIANGIRGYRFLFLLTSYFIFMKIDYTYKDLIKIQKYIIVISIITSLYALVQAYLGVPFFEEKWLRSFSISAGFLNSRDWESSTMFIGKKLRVYSFLPSGPELGQILTYGLNSLLMFLLIKKRNKSEIIGIVFLAGLFTLAIIETVSRGTIISFICGIIVFLYFYFSEKASVGRIIKLTSSFLIIAIFLFPLIYNYFVPESSLSARFIEIFNPMKSGSFIARVITWGLQFRMIFENPLGLGMGAAGYTGYSYGSELSIALTDSTYLWLLVNLGFIGLFIFILIIYQLIKIFISIYSQELPRNSKVVVLILFINSVTFIIYAIVGTNIEMRTSIIFFCFYLVLLIKSEHYLPNENIASSY